MTALARRKKVEPPTKNAANEASAASAASETISSEEMGSLVRLMGAHALRAGLGYLVDRFGRENVERMIARRPDGLASRTLVRVLDVEAPPEQAVQPAVPVTTVAATTPPPPGATSKFLDEKQLCGELGISPVTATKWRGNAEGPPFIRVGRLIRYAREAVDAWLTERTVGSGAPRS